MWLADVLPYLFAAALLSGIVGIWYMIIADRKDRKREENE